MEINMMIAFADFHARYTHCCDKFAAVCFLMCFLTRVFRLQAMYSQTKDDPGLSAGLCRYLSYDVVTLLSFLVRFLGHTNQCDDLNPIDLSFFLSVGIGCKCFGYQYKPVIHNSIAKCLIRQ